MPDNISFLTDPYGRINQIDLQRTANKEVVKAESATVAIAKVINENKELLEADLSLRNKKAELLEAQKNKNDSKAASLTSEISALTGILTGKEEVLQKAQAEVKYFFEKAGEYGYEIFADSEAPTKNLQLLNKKYEIATLTNNLVEKEATKAKMQAENQTTDEIDAEITALKESLATTVEDFNALNKEYLARRAIVQNSLPKNAGDVTPWLINAAANPKLIEDAQKRINTISSENRALLFKSEIISVTAVPIFHAFAAVGHAFCFVIKTPLSGVVSLINLVAKKDSLNNWGVSAAAMHGYKTLAYVLSAPISFAVGFFTAGYAATKFATLIKLHTALAQSVTEEDQKEVANDIAKKRNEAQALFNTFKVDLNQISNENPQLKSDALARATQDTVKLEEIKNELIKKYEEAKATAKEFPKHSQEAQKAEWTAVQYLAAANEHAFAFGDDKKAKMVASIEAYKKANIQYYSTLEAVKKDVANFQQKINGLNKGNRFVAQNEAVAAYNELAKTKETLTNNLKEAKARLEAAVKSGNHEAVKIEKWLIGCYENEVKTFNNNVDLNAQKEVLKSNEQLLNDQKSWKLGKQWLSRENYRAPKITTLA